MGVLAIVLAAVVALAVAKRGGDDSPSASTGTDGAAAKAPLPELPRGGRTLFPDRRVVAFAGAPQDEELGILGIGSLTGAIGKLEQQAKAYSRKTRPDQPALELISTVVHQDPGRSGRYSERQPRSVVERHLRAARKAKALLILDIQPGRATFTSETARLERYLKEPDVALALDPEWRMGPGQVPGQVIGSVGRAELQASLNRVAKIVKDNRLPPKLVLVHRFTENMIKGLDRIKVPRGVLPVMSIDGVGDRPNKVAKYRLLTRDLPRGWRPGFKLFYKEDKAAGGLMTPSQVMGLTPRPEVVVYE